MWKFYINRITHINEIRVVWSTLISKSDSSRFAKSQVGLESVCDFLNRLQTDSNRVMTILEKNVQINFNKTMRTSKFFKHFYIFLLIIFYFRVSPSLNNIKFELSLVLTGMVKNVWSITQTDSKPTCDFANRLELSRL